MFGISPQKGARSHRAPEARGKTCRNICVARSRVDVLSQATTVSCVPSGPVPPEAGCDLTACMGRSMTFRMAAAMLCFALALLLTACGVHDNTAQIEMHKKLAGELENNKLYAGAVEEYEKALALDGLSDRERGNICYLIGRTYYRDLNDYAQAAAYFVRAKEYDPNGSYEAEASKNLVACLEKLGNYQDARRQLDAAVDINPGPASDSDVIVAKIGGRDVWLSEVDRQIMKLPKEAQDKLRDIGAKIQYVRQYVGVELLYDAAVRADYLSNPEIRQEKDDLVKRLLVERYVTEKVMPKLKADTMDVRNFYEANKDQRYNGKPYDSVRADVFLDYQQSKAEAVYSDYIADLAKAENVQFFDKRVK